MIKSTSRASMSSSGSEETGARRHDAMDKIRLDLDREAVLELQSQKGMGAAFVSKLADQVT